MTLIVITFAEFKFPLTCHFTFFDKIAYRKNWIKDKNTKSSTFVIGRLAPDLFPPRFSRCPDPPFRSSVVEQGRDCPLCSKIECWNVGSRNERNGNSQTGYGNHVQLEINH